MGHGSAYWRISLAAAFGVSVTTLVCERDSLAYARFLDDSACRILLRKKGEVTALSVASDLYVFLVIEALTSLLIPAQAITCFITLSWIEELVRHA